MSPRIITEEEVGQLVRAGKLSLAEIAEEAPVQAAQVGLEVEEPEEKEDEGSDIMAAVGQIVGALKALKTEPAPAPVVKVNIPPRPTSWTLEVTARDGNGNIKTVKIVGGEK